MEKFTSWDDRATGINPFIEVKTKPRSILTILIGIILGIIRIPFVLLFFAILLVCELIVWIVFLPPLRRLLKILLVAPVARLLLFSLGYHFIQENVPDHRRLRLGRLPSSFKVPGFGATVKNGDVILCNHTSFVEVLYLTWRFGAEFVQVDLPNGTTTSFISLLQTLRKACRNYMVTNHRNDISTNGKENIWDVVKKAGRNSNAPVVIFAEGIRSNGKALLKFPVVIEELVNTTKDQRIHLLGFKYQTNSFSPSYSVGTFSSYLFGTLFHPNHSMKVHIVSHELRTINNDKASTNIETIRPMLAQVIGERGCKCVDLSIKEYFAFLDYYKDNKQGKKRS